MSPIGQVFIVLNLIGAGVFLGFSGSYLQKQQNFKTLYEQRVSDSDAKIKTLEAQIDDLGKERNKFESAKSSAEAQLGEAKNENAKLIDDNKRLLEENRAQGISLSSLQSDVAKIGQEIKTVNERADAAAAASIAHLQEKNTAVNERVEAIRAKDQLLEVKKALEASIAKLTDDNKNLDRERSELGLLVKVAQDMGFIREMAAPDLTGEVTNVSDRLCTIAIRGNDGKVDIADQIQKGKWGFAIYDASGYKGEAVAKEYDASANAVFCNIVLVKGTITPGDKARTKLN